MKYRYNCWRENRIFKLYLYEYCDALASLTILPIERVVTNECLTFQRNV